MKRVFFLNLSENRSALKIKHGIILLSLLHLEKRVPIEEFLPEVSISTRYISLVAWHPL
jgi:hypothetical protein